MRALAIVAFCFAPACPLLDNTHRRLSINYMEDAKLTASDAAAGDNFGHSVAIAGNTVVAGAYTKDSHKGVVYVLRTSDGGATYDEVAKLTASDAKEDAHFGFSVAIDGDTVAVGAAGCLTCYFSGAVYIFRTSDGGATYPQVAKLTASDATGNFDYFGYSVAIDGNTVVVGAKYKEAVYVFRTTDDGATYDQVAKLTAWGASSMFNEFGQSVAIDGGTVVVSEEADAGAGYYTGAVYVFRTSDGGATYGQVAKLTASDGAANDRFGVSVAIDGDTIVVGAGSEPGAVYVFLTTDGGATYGEVAKLTASDPSWGDEFGSSVAINGTTIVAGAKGDGGTAGFSDGTGSAYVFRTSDGGFTVVKAKSGTQCGEGDATGNKVLVPSALAATRCCGSIFDSFCGENDKDKCVNGAAPGYVTYEVAKATCEDAGARLCTPDELALKEDEGGVMGTGCDFDRAYVWSSEAKYDQAKLTASDGAASDSFGSSLAIAGDTIVIGASYDDDSTGAVYVFASSPETGALSDAATRAGPLLALLIVAATTVLAL